LLQPGETVACSAAVFFVDQVAARTDSLSVRVPGGGAAPDRRRLHFRRRMHERYLFPAVALAILAFIYLGDRRLLLPALGFSATSYVNTHVVLFETLRGINAALYGPALIGASVLNVLLFAYLVKVLIDIAVLKRTVPLETLPEG
jgi:hypothetical protein